MVLFHAFLPIWDENIVKILRLCSELMREKVVPCLLVYNSPSSCTSEASQCFCVCWRHHLPLPSQRWSSRRSHGRSPPNFPDGVAGTALGETSLSQPCRVSLMLLTAHSLPWLAWPLFLHTCPHSHTCSKGGITPGFS